MLFDHANGYLSPASAMDAEEWAQANRDAELGRWRVPTQPDIVVYPVGDGNEVRVFSEAECYLSQVITRNEATAEFDPTSAMGNAHAYFETHPERKPWEDAKPEEVWLMGSGLHEFVALVGHDGRFRFADGSDMSPTETFVTGRRIWPEDAS
ncbi:hypothetical protein ABY45_14715 [Microbacterium maritypicum]|uniref:hypothetical protein n=1 Tax=Microbacterium maritypicum TaxID=33918 RepID=UPI003D6FFB67